VEKGEIPWARPAAVILTKALVGALVLWGGFRAISDDDYARVVIAQSFAAHPRIDPSGTSWLPLPFWLGGGVMMLLGTSLAVARVTAYAMGIIAALLVFVAARWLGASPRGALIGALIGCLFPYSAWLGVATVPDGPTAALILIGLGALCDPTPRRLVLGSLALFGATLCRYEAWPVALGFVVVGMLDAWRARSVGRALGTTVALLGPLAWMAHGLAHHGDATFFLTRVATYRHAIGGGSASSAAGAIWFPVALIRSEPELVASLLVALGIARRAGGLAELGRYRRALSVGLALLGFLVLGDLAGGAATHHRERSLLALWLLGAVLAGDLLDRAWNRLGHAGRRVAPGAVILAAALTALGVRPWSARREGFVDRSEEVHLGERARAEAASRPGNLLVDTKDYGFFAAMAAFGHPGMSSPADDRDPRRRPGLDIFSSEAELRRGLGQSRWLIATREHRDLALRVGSLVAETSRFVLLRVGP
jgi:hypothetical protein